MRRWDKWWMSCHRPSMQPLHPPPPAAIAPTHSYLQHPPPALTTSPSDAKPMHQLWYLHLSLDAPFFCDQEVNWNMKFKYCGHNKAQVSGDKVERIERKTDREKEVCWVMVVGWWGWQWRALLFSPPCRFYKHLFCYFRAFLAAPCVPVPRGEFPRVEWVLWKCKIVERSWNNGEIGEGKEWRFNQASCPTSIQYECVW